MTKSLAEYDTFIQQEMLVHTAFFTHPRVKRVAILGDNNLGIVQECLKHADIQEIFYITATASICEDKRVTMHVVDSTDWLRSQPPGSIDLIITTEPANLTEKNYSTYLQALHVEGMLVLQTESAFNLLTIKTIFNDLKKCGFSDSHILHFPQPSFPSGWRAAIMAVKQGMFRRIREKDIFNKNFTTRYYNYDVHKAALVMPEFMRDELTV
jgi:spermidine synthase